MSQKWRQLLRENFTCWKKLSDFLELKEEHRFRILEKSTFSLNLPKRLAQKIEKGNIDDPILRQFLPMTDELQILPGFRLDPVGDKDAQIASKLLHKYEGRALLVSTGACAMHCRFCFRRNFDYDNKDRTFEKELEILKNDTSIHEVILSGGDPLSLSDEILENLLQALSKMTHIKRLRFHTRFPIGIPERIDESFSSLLKKSTQQIWFILHCNHVYELDEEILAAMRKLQSSGIIILNQTVLLKGVNDSSQALKDLFETLVNHGIVPYYLHQLDRVQGAGHFEVAEDTGKKILEQIAQVLPGYAIPRYVREDAGATSKTFLT